MSNDRSPSLIHATTVALGPVAIVLRGPPGSGKSDLALRFLFTPPANELDARPRRLVADDQTCIDRRGGAVFASCPPTISGKLEVRGVGIVPVSALINDVRVGLVVDLVANHGEIERLPAIEVTELLGCRLPYRRLYPFEASAPLKLALAAALAL